VLPFGDLAGDIGDNRPEPGQFPWCLGQTGQGLQIDMNIHHPPPGRHIHLVAFQEV
jgi:hypothetical protein